MNKFQMERSAPSIFLVRSMKVLLLLSHHEPVENHNNHVANDGHRVEKMMSSLHVNGSIRGHEWIFTEVSSILGSANAWPERNSGEHKSPIGERNKETIPVHVKGISAITDKCHWEHQIPHSLSCVNFTLFLHFLLWREILKLLKLIVLIWIVLRRDVVNVVWPILPEISEVDLSLLVILHWIKFDKLIY